MEKTQSNPVGAGSLQNTLNANYTQTRTKKSTIIQALKLPEGVNRFEAERLGDHCLNSTISTLRAEGWNIVSHWEIVPCRFTSKGVRVKRYRMVAE